jgi:hypothetical protein
MMGKAGSPAARSDHGDLSGIAVPAEGIVLMRLNIWMILAAALLALLVITRYMQHRELPAICADHPTAPECHR